MISTQEGAIGAQSGRIGAEHGAIGSRVGGAREAAEGGLPREENGWAQDPPKAGRNGVSRIRGGAPNAGACGLGYVEAESLADVASCQKGGSSSDAASSQKLGGKAERGSSWKGGGGVEMLSSQKGVLGVEMTSSQQVERGAERGAALNQGNRLETPPSQKQDGRSVTPSSQKGGTSPTIGLHSRTSRFADSHVNQPSPRPQINLSDGATCQSVAGSDSDETPRPRSGEKASTSEHSFSGPESMDYGRPTKRGGRHRLRFLGAVKQRIKRAFSFSLPRAAALDEVLCGLQEANGGQPVPEVLKQDIREHYEKLPVAYAEAIFPPDEVLLHMRLLHEAAQHPESAPLLHVSSFQTYSGFLSLLSSKKARKQANRRATSMTLDRRAPNRNLSLNDLVNANQSLGAGVSSESPSESGFSPSEASVTSTEEDFLTDDVSCETVMHSVVYADVSPVNAEVLTGVLRKRGLKVKKAKAFHGSGGPTLGMLLLKGGVAHDLRAAIRGGFAEARELSKPKLKLKIPHPPGMDSLTHALKQGFGRTASTGRLSAAGGTDSPRWDFGEIEQWISESGLEGGSIEEETEKTVRGIENMMSGKGPMGCWLLDRRQLQVSDCANEESAASTPLTRVGPARFFPSQIPAQEDRGKSRNGSALRYLLVVVVGQAVRISHELCWGQC